VPPEASSHRPLARPLHDPPTTSVAEVPALGGVVAGPTALPTETKSRPSTGTRTSSNIFNFIILFIYFIIFALGRGNNINISNNDFNLEME
jgi:hypothetical protein